MTIDTSLTIGANTLTEATLGLIDGIDQDLSTTASPWFTKLGIGAAPTYNFHMQATSTSSLASRFYEETITATGNDAFLFGHMSRNFIEFVGGSSNQYTASLIGIRPTVPAGATVTVATGLQVNIGIKTGTGTITLARGGVFRNPSIGTTNQALWAEDLIIGTSYVATAAPSNGLLCEGQVLVGASSGTGKVYVEQTSEQLRLANDGSNFTSFTVDSSGDLTIAPSGGDVDVTGTLACDTSLTIDAVSIGATALDFANDLDQQLTQASSPTFASVTIGASVPFADAAGTLTLQNVDALDATTEATIEAAIDTLPNLASIGTNLDVNGTVTCNTSLTIDAVSIGATALDFANDLNQQLTTTSNVQFGSIGLGVSPSYPIHASQSQTNALYGVLHNNVNTVTSSGDYVGTAVFPSMNFSGAITSTYTGLQVAVRPTVGVGSSISFINGLQLIGQITNNGTISRSRTLVVPLLGVGSGLEIATWTENLGIGSAYELQQPPTNGGICEGQFIVGATSGTGKLHVLDTSEQLRLAYDGSNYCQFTVSSSGDLTIDPTGGDVTVDGTTVTTVLNVAPVGGLQRDVINIGSGGTLMGDNFGFCEISSGFAGKNLRLTRQSDNATNTQLDYDGTADSFLGLLGGDYGFGTATPAAKVHSLATTEQLRLGYDGSNYCQFTVSSSGDLTIDPTGGDVTVDGTLNSTSASITNTITAASLNLGESDLSFFQTGTWTPTVGDGTNEFTYATQDGNYQRIGDVVFVTFEIIYSSKGSASGGLFINGFTFAPNTSLGERACQIHIDATNTAAQTFYVSAQDRGIYDDTGTQATDATFGAAGIIRGNGFYWA